MSAFSDPFSKIPSKYFVSSNSLFIFFEFGGKQFSEFKEKLSEVLIERIGPISKEIKKLLEDQKFLDSVLLEGSNKADKIASKKMKEMKELVGF